MIKKGVLKMKKVERIRLYKSYTEEGNDYQCSGCYTDEFPFIQYGDSPDWDSSWASVCKNCLLKGLKMLEEVK
jgi:hypothetical protein